MPHPARRCFRPFCSVALQRSVSEGYTSRVSPLRGRYTKRPVAVLQCCTATAPEGVSALDVCADRQVISGNLATNSPRVAGAFSMRGMGREADEVCCDGCREAEWSVAVYC